MLQLQKMQKVVRHITKKQKERVKDYNYDYVLRYSTYLSL